MRVILIASLAVMVLAGVPVKEQRLKGLNFNQVMDIIGGIFSGMGSAVNITEMAPCVTDAGTFGGWIEQSVVDFSKHTFDGTKDGFMDLSNAFGVLPSAIKECVPASVEFASVVERAALAWAHPLSLLYHVGENIVFNGVVIFADISKAMADYETGNWFGFGFEIGQAAFKVIYVPPKTVGPPTDAQSELIVNGIFKGLGQKTTCSGLPLSAEYWGNAVSELKTKTFAGVKNGLTQVANGLNTVLPGLKNCVDGETITQIQNAVNVFSNPYSFEVGKFIVMINGRAVGKELKLAVVDYMMEDWTGFGFYIGKAIRNLE
jgi:hypothetical protein